MKKKYLALLGFCGILSVSFVGCSRSNDAQTLETQAVDVLSSDEKRVYDAVIDLSSSFKNDSSIRVKEWYKIVDSDEQDALGGFEISGENSMGGLNSSLYGYNVNTKKLEQVEDDMESFMLYAFTDDECFQEQDQETIDRINRAVAEYFENRGY